MLFNTFYSTVQKYQTALAINDLTYQEVYDLVKSREYKSVSYETDWTVLLDILKAAEVNKPIVILPKFHREEVDIPSELPDEFGIILYSSGSTGVRKQIFMPERMIVANAENAIRCQRIIPADKILTVCSLNHTGGISAQSLPGLLVGAHVIVTPFNVFNFFKIIQIEKITLTHLVPIMIEGLEKVKNKYDLSSLRLVVAGSDCVYKKHVEFWISRGVNFMSNYGLTEAGPIIINKEYTKDTDLSIFDQGVPLGTVAWCDTKIENGELLLKGDCISNNQDWFKTGDCVYQIDQWYMYQGRLAAGCKILPKKY